MNDGNVFSIDSQNVGGNIFNIAKDLNITQNSPAKDVLQIIQAIQQKVDESDIGDEDKIKIGNHLDNVKNKLEEKEPNKKSIEESIKQINEILKEARTAGETLKDIGLLIGKTAGWLGILL